MPDGLAKNLEYPNRKDSANFGSRGRDFFVEEIGLTHLVFHGSSFIEGNSDWKQSRTSFATSRIALGLSLASSSAGTLKVMRVRLGRLLLDPCVVASSALVSSSMIGSESVSSAKNSLRSSKELVGAVEVVDIVLNEVEVAVMIVSVLLESDEV